MQVGVFDRYLVYTKPARDPVRVLICDTKLAHNLQNYSQRMDLGGFMITIVSPTKTPFRVALPKLIHEYNIILNPQFNSKTIPFLLFSKETLSFYLLSFFFFFVNNELMNNSKQSKRKQVPLIIGSSGQINRCYLRHHPKMWCNT